MDCTIVSLSKISSFRGVSDRLQNLFKINRLIKVNFFLNNELKIILVSTIPGKTVKHM